MHSYRALIMRKGFNPYIYKFAESTPVSPVPSLWLISYKIRKSKQPETVGIGQFPQKCLGVGVRLDIKPNTSYTPLREGKTAMSFG